MKIVSISTEGGMRLGLRAERGIVDVRAALEEHAPKEDRPIALELPSLLDGGEPAWRALEDYANALPWASPEPGWLLREDEITLGPCVLASQKIICVGLNYREHAAEAEMDIPEQPILFAKLPNTLAASGEPVPLPAVAEQYDYEAELGVVIGRRARGVSEEEALGHVFGYCNANDLSARDLQFRSSQWLLGKTLDKFLPLGPYLVTADEVDDPQLLDIRCWVNEELRQESNTADMIFTIAQLVSYISRYATLEPGDLILTGTPSGVAAGRPERDWLVPGDQVTVEVQGLGRLTNRMTSPMLA